MRNDKEKAIKLRKQGKSYNEIKAALKIPKSTLSDWFSKDAASADLRRKLNDKSLELHTERLRELHRIRGSHLLRAYEEARSEAKMEFEDLKYNPLFIAGVMLYWGEGDKAGKYAVRLVNSEPEMLRLFYQFLRVICRIPQEKIWASVILYPDLQEQVCRSFWAENTGVPVERFTKATVIQGKSSRRTLSYGVCTIGVSSTYFKAKVTEWLKLLPAELMNRPYYENM